MTNRPVVSKILRNPSSGILALSGAALLVHGYHLGVDDAEIYLPAIKRAADPQLFPFASEFFMTHAHFSLFPDLVGGIARLAHLPADTAILLCHAAGLYLMLLAAWKLASACFDGAPARWGAVALLAGALSMPVAGTALSIFDPYVTARTLSAPATLFAVACWVANQRKRAMGWLLFAALVHPQMSVYGAVVITCLVLERKLPGVRGEAAAFSAALPFLWGFGPATGAAREALLSRTYFFISKWAWYEVFGIFAPLGLLGWWALRPPRGTTPAFQRLARTLVPFGLLFTLAGMVLSSTVNLENFARLQPLRAFHLIYMILFVLLGGIAGEFVLRRQAWRWFALFVPLAAGMWILQAASYPFSPHLEWPGLDGGNRWVAAFLWVRENTPKDAVFALDPNYMAAASDDQHGFRAVAERSALADNVKDSGAVSLFPQLADRWKSQVLAQTGWAGFDGNDFRRLARQYPVTWIVAREPNLAGLRCPYKNSEVAVCHIDAAVVTRNLGLALPKSGQ